MANKYYKQAAAEVGASINSGLATNSGSAKKLMAQYANYLNQLAATQTADVGAMDNAQLADRSRMSSMLAARGLSGAGASQSNYGRMQGQHEGAKASLLGNYANQRGNLLTQQGGKMDEIEAANAALMAARVAKTGELARLLEDRDRQAQYQQAQLALQRAANARAAADGDWQREQAMSQQEKADEYAFRENLREMAAGATNLVGLAQYARANDRDLNDYYEMMGRPDLVNSARGRYNRTFPTAASHDVEQYAPLFSTRDSISAHPLSSFLSVYGSGYRGNYNGNMYTLDRQ